MKKIIFNLLMFSLVVIMSSINVKASETYKMGNNVYVAIDTNKRIAEISGTGEMFNYDIDGFDASGNFKNPFLEHRQIEKLIINEGITSIGSNAFRGLGLYEANISNTVKTIGFQAFFMNGNLKRINIPYGVQKIEGYAFYAAMNATYNPPQPLTLPDSITDIGDYAFSVCRISDVKLPNQIKTIRNNTFNNCRDLKNVNLPNSVTKVEEYAFKDCVELTDINIPGSMQTIGANAFAGCRRLFNVTMQEGVRTIDDNAFNGCIRLQTITLPSTIQSIGSYAFNQCTMLRSVMVRNGNAKLGSGVFDGCPVTLSASKGSRVQAYAKSNGIGFKDNGSYAVPYPSQDYISGSFRYKVLTSGSNGGTVQVIAPINNKKTKLTIPATVKLNTYNFTVTSIAKNAFKSNKKLKTVNIGKYVTSIGDRAFYNCSALTTVKFGSRVNEIGKAAFRGCSNLKKVKLPTKVTSIKDEMFYGCKKLTSVTLGNNTTTVGNSAFSGCSSLKSITIPSRVRTLGSKAFYNCKNLKKITVKGTALRKVGSSALKKINSRATIKVPKSKVRKYTTLFKGKGQSKTVKVSK